MKYLYLVLSLGLFTACEYDEIAPIKTVTPTDSSSTTAVSYATQVAPVLKNYCASCHEQYTTALDGFSYIQSSGITDTTDGAEASILYAKIIEHESTQGVVIPSLEKSHILHWIKQGASNN